MQAPVLSSDTALWKYDCFLDKLYVEILKNAFEPQPCSWTSTNNKKTGRQLENYCHTHDCLTILGATFCSHSHVFHNQVRQNALNGRDYFLDEQKRMNKNNEVRVRRHKTYHPLTWNGRRTFILKMQKCSFTAHYMHLPGKCMTISTFSSKRVLLSLFYCS